MLGHCYDVEGLGIHGLNDFLNLGAKLAGARGARSGNILVRHYLLPVRIFLRIQ